MSDIDDEKKQSIISDQSDSTNQMVDSVPAIKEQSAFSIVLDFILGVITFGILDVLISFGVSNIFELILMITVNIIGIFYCRKRYKYFMYGILSLLIFEFIFFIYMWLIYLQWNDSWD
jgi:hypothetical protein